MEIKISDDIINAQKNTDVGVLICRFQTNDLHAGHKELVNYVLRHHHKVIIFLGVAKSKSRKNPLDFATRKAMVQEEFPTAVILPIYDQRSSDIWSQVLDEKCKEPFGEKKFLLYGSRDSFIPAYSGKNQTVELDSSVNMNASSIREEIAREGTNTSDARKGVIQEVYSNRPSIYPAVDIVISKNDGTILLAKKPNEPLYRFVGGFVDSTDKSWEEAAHRELHEETGLRCQADIEYVLSHGVDDWRYRGTENCIKTTLFHGRYASGMAVASDDIVHVAWIEVSKLSNQDGIIRMIMPEHREMMTKFIEKVYKNNLIEGIGPKLDELENVTYHNDIK